MMTCRDVHFLVPAYVRDQMPFDARLALQRHLAACQACASKVERARDAHDLSRCASRAAPDPGPEDVPAALVAAILHTSRHVVPLG